MDFLVSVIILLKPELTKVFVIFQIEQQLAAGTVQNIFFLFSS